jgi:hypothetical protein
VKIAVSFFNSTVASISAITNDGATKASASELDSIDFLNIFFPLPIRLICYQAKKPGQLFLVRP